MSPSVAYPPRSSSVPDIPGDTSVKAKPSGRLR
jgi:hypothetical protein